MRLRFIAVLFLTLALSALVPSSASAQPSNFLTFVQKRLEKEKLALATVCPIDTSDISRRVFLEYGAMFVSTDDVRVPPTCTFNAIGEVDAFHSKLDTKKHLFGMVEIELQEAAMKSLIKATHEAQDEGLSITPLDGAIAGRRNYDDTVRIWNSRFFRALEYWELRGKIPGSDALKARVAPTIEQIKFVAAWEEQGFFFSTNFSKSIFHSVAPPGTSQHISMLAFDVVEAGNPDVRRILNKHGWFQTIRSDQPHFTYLGLDEKDLPNRGLKQVIHQGNFYWVPNLDDPLSTH